MNAQQLANAVDTNALAPDTLILVPALGDGQHQYGSDGYLPRGTFTVLSPAQIAAYRAFMGESPGAPMSRDDAIRVQSATSVLWAIRNEWENAGA